MARSNIHFEENRLKLIRIAFSLFIQKGYESTSIQDILKASGISKGGMYHYFSSKEDILDAVLNYIVDIDKESFDAVINSPHLGAFEKLIAIIGRSDQDAPDEVKEATQHVLERPRSIFDYRSREISLIRSLPAMTQIIKEGIQSGEFQTDYPEEVAEMMLSFSRSVSLWLAETPKKEKWEKEMQYFTYLIQVSLHLPPDKVDILYKTFQLKIAP